MNISIINIQSFQPVVRLGSLSDFMLLVSGAVFHPILLFLAITSHIIKFILHKILLSCKVFLSACSLFIYLNREKLCTTLHVHENPRLVDLMH